ncbi:MAG: hypothetical protein ACTICG_03750 [Corynebacterium casei]|uniref:hypothetical protein n=1 Tax=Corynebacterium casei TaxID=160386 RepID=UPI003F938555
MTTHKDDKSQMFDSFLWDDFCKCQGVTSIKEDIDPVSSGILAKLMTKNTSAEATFDCIFYSDGTWDEQGAFQTFDVFHVDAHPAHSAFSTVHNGSKLLNFGPLMRDGGLIAEPRHIPGSASPQILLDFEHFPYFWGSSFSSSNFSAESVQYPHAFSLADSRYIRVISYSEEELHAHQLWHEVVIDTEFSIAVLYARHVQGGIDSVWTMLRFEHNGSPQGFQDKSMQYLWSF